MKFGLILQNVSHMPCDSCKTLVQQSLVSHNIPCECCLVSFSLVQQSQDIPEIVTRHSHKCRLVLLSHQTVVSCLHFVFHSRLLYDIPTTFMGVYVAYLLHCEFAKVWP